MVDFGKHISVYEGWHPGVTFGSGFFDMLSVDETSIHIRRAEVSIGLL